MGLGIERHLAAAMIFRMVVGGIDTLRFLTLCPTACVLRCCIIGRSLQIYPPSLGCKTIQFPPEACRASSIYFHPARLSFGLNNKILKVLLQLHGCQAASYLLCPRFEKAAEAEFGNGSGLCMCGVSFFFFFGENDLKNTKDLLRSWCASVFRWGSEPVTYERLAKLVV